MQRISISELREISQPASITGRSNAEHWTADLYLRKISPYLTRILISTRISPNGVTWLMIVTGISTGLALLIPGYKGILLALFLSQLQMLWDCCDGELARWKKKFSPAGIFLDTIGHYSAEATIVLMLGLRAANWPAAGVQPVRGKKRRSLLRNAVGSRRIWRAYFAQLARYL